MFYYCGTGVFVADRVTASSSSLSFCIVVADFTHFPSNIMNKSERACGRCLLMTRTGNKLSGKEIRGEGECSDPLVGEGAGASGGDNLWPPGEPTPLIRENGEKRVNDEQQQQ
jgi:hypothetical protein